MHTTDTPHTSRNSGLHRGALPLFGPCFIDCDVRCLVRSASCDDDEDGDIVMDTVAAVIAIAGTGVAGIINAPEVDIEAEGEAGLSLVSM